MNVQIPTNTLQRDAVTDATRFVRKLEDHKEANNA